MTDRKHTVVVGGGQAGLSVGYHLKRAGLDFVILDANEQTGDSWRNRWDSLRIFTTARYSGLHGMRFPTVGDRYPTKDEVADYLQAYSLRFELPIMHRTRVDHVSRHGDGFMIASEGFGLEADNVVIAMADFQTPKTPEFATQLDPSISQLHSVDYHRPSDLGEGDALVVGSGNSGVEIALDLAGGRRVFLSGQHPGHVPFDIEGKLFRKVLAHLVLGFVFHRALTVRNPLGRRFLAHRLSGGDNWVRSRPEDVERAGIERVDRVSTVKEGLPVLETGETLDVANVVWATGFESGFESWIDFDIFEKGRPRHDAGIVPEVAGLYFVGLDFMVTPSSGMFHGVGRDARRIVEHIGESEPRSQNAQWGVVPPAETANRPIH